MGRSKSRPSVQVYTGHTMVIIIDTMGRFQQTYLQICTGHYQLVIVNMIRRSQ